jgi:hypothetical protein
MQVYRYQSRRFSETTSRFETYRRCTQSDRSHDSSRVQGELRSALRHTLDPAAPTTCDRDSVHRLPILAEAHSARDDEDSAPPSPPTLNSTRNVSSCRRKHEPLTGGSFPFEVVIARNTIPSIEAGLPSPIFQNASRWLWPQRLRRRGPNQGKRGRVAFGAAQPATREPARACSHKRRRRFSPSGAALPDPSSLPGYKILGAPIKFSDCHSRTSRLPCAH